MFVSIVIPAFNEEQRIGSTLSKIKGYLDSRGFEHEVIVVDDGSSDKTAQVAEEFKGLSLRVLKNEKNSGKGYSINRGMMEARGNLVLFTDADMSTPIEFFDGFIKQHEYGYDIVIASRAIDRSLVRKKQPFHREMMGRVFNLFVRMITGLSIRDTQCGFKSFKRQAVQSVYPKQTIYDFGFDVEILYIAKLQGFKIMEAPVEWYDSPATKVSALKDSFMMFFDLLRIRFTSYGDN